MKDSISNRKMLLVSCAFLILLWWGFALFIDKSYILPTPWVVVKATGQLLVTPATYGVILGTLMRVLICIFISFILGISLAIISHFFASMRYFLKPILLIVRTLPTIVIIVYVVLWMSSSLAPIFVTFLVTFPIVYTNVLEGIDHVDKKWLEMAHIYQLSVMKKMKAIYLPSIRTYLEASLTSVANLALKVVIASEVLSQTKGSIGRHFQMAKINIETEKVFAWALITIVIAVGVDYLLKKVTKHEI